MATSTTNRGEKAKSQSRELLQTWTRELTDRYPEPPMGELEAEGLRDELAKRLARVGPERLKRALQRCILENPNYGKRPTLEHIDQRTPGSDSIAYANKSCPDCQGTGWAWADEARTRVRRCHCWRVETA